MKSEIKLIREISYTEVESYIDGVPPQKIEITLDGDLTLTELLEQFNRFVHCMGYTPPKNSVLDFVSADPDVGCCHGCQCDHDQP